jgi:hypothetical protein
MGSTSSSPASLPSLPDELLRLIAVFLDPAGFLPMEKVSFVRYRTLLMMLKLTRVEIRRKMDAYERQGTTPIHDLGFHPLLGGYGEMVSIICRQPTVLFVNHPVYRFFAHVGDVLSRDYDSDSLWLSRKGEPHDVVIGSSDDTLCVCSSHFVRRVECNVTPGW